MAKKKNIFSDEALFDLGGHVNKQNCRIWGTENPHPKRVTFWCRFWSRGIIGPFLFENEQGKRGGEVVTVNGDRYRAMLNEFLFTNIEEEDIDYRTALRATQPKLHSMFCALFLITLSAAELMSFGHLGAGI